MTAHGFWPEGVPLWDEEPGSYRVSSWPEMTLNSCQWCMHGTPFKMNRRSPRKYEGSRWEPRAFSWAYILWLQI